MDPSLIRSEVPLITRGDSAYPYSEKLKRKYQFEDRFGDLTPMYREQDGLLWLPRALCPIGEQDQRAVGKPALFPKEPLPKDYQVDMFGLVDEVIASEQSGVLLAPTGFGKTYLGYRAAWAAQVKTLIITTKSDIYDQWIEGAETALGLSPTQIGELRQDKCEVQGRSFVVSLVQSLAKDKYASWIYDEFGLTIFDEFHRMPATHFMPTVPRITSKRRLGLSATSDRKDGKEQIFMAHVGPILAAAPEELMIPKVLRVRSEWTHPRKFVKDKETGGKKVVRVKQEPGKSGLPEKSLAVDDTRNALIADYAIMAKGKGRATVVFASAIMHLEQIEVALKSKGVHAKDIGWYVSESTVAGKAKRDKDKVKPILLATFGMMSEGTSIDWLDTAILAFPRSDVRQPAGRIRREFEGKRFPLLIDVVDNDSHVFRSYAAKRLGWYNEIGCEVEDLW